MLEREYAENVLKPGTEAHCVYFSQPVSSTHMLHTGNSVHDRLKLSTRRI